MPDAAYLTPPPGGVKQGDYIELVRLEDVPRLYKMAAPMAGASTGTFAAGDDGRITGALPAAGGDASAVVVRASSAPRARALGQITVDRVNARDYAAGDGVTSDGPALSQAAAFAAATGRDLFIPGGIYVVRGDAPFVLAPGVCVYMDRRVTLRCVVPAGGGYPVTNNALAGDYAIVGGTLTGEANTNQVQTSHNLFISGAGRVLLDGVTSRFSRGFGMVVYGCAEAIVRGCRIYRSLGDGIAVWDTPNAKIVHNHIDGANDDAISAHCNDSAAVPRSGVVIAHNTIVESQGIDVLGPKLVTIADNVLRRIMSYGITAGLSPPFPQGHTPAIALRITGNHISDVFLRPDGRNSFQGYIYLSMPPRSAGSAAAAPGDPAPSSGQVASLLGTGPGLLNQQTASGAATPGALWCDVSGNTLVRTRPACAAYGDWGEASALWVGDKAPATAGLSTAGIGEANLQTPGIIVSGALRDSRISGNIIQTTGSTGIFLSGATTINSGDYNGLDIDHNLIADFSSFGIGATQAAATQHQMRVRGNTLNGDKYFRHPNRGAGGAWAADAPPAGLWLPTIGGAVIESNHFRNLVRPVHLSSQVGVLAGNVYFGNCPAAAFSTANAGIGFAPTPGAGWLYVPEDADPRSATYGQVLAAPVPVIGGATSLGVLADLNLAGTGSLAGAWTSAVVPVSAGSGSFTAASAVMRYRKMGRTVNFNVVVSITTAGSAAGQVSITLPFAVQGNPAFSGRENSVTGRALCAFASGSIMAIFFYDNTSVIGDGRTLTVSGTYEATA